MFNLYNRVVGLSVRYVTQNKRFLNHAKIAVCMRFTAKDQQTLASNISLGGSAQLEQINIFSENQQYNIIQACKALNITIAGVDLIKKDDKIYILEVNNSPGLCTSYNLGCDNHLNMIVEYCINKYLQNSHEELNEIKNEDQFTKYKN